MYMETQLLSEKYFKKICDSELYLKRDDTWTVAIYTPVNVTDLNRYDSCTLSIYTPVNAAN